MRFALLIVAVSLIAFAPCFGADKQHVSSIRAKAKPVHAPSSSVAASNAPSTSVGTTGALETDDDAAISFKSTIRARELKFEQAGHVHVTFPQSDQSKSKFSSVRTNFPKPVQPGVTYKNIRVDVDIHSNVRNNAAPIESNVNVRSGQSSPANKDHGTELPSSPSGGAHE